MYCIFLFYPVQCFLWVSHTHICQFVVLEGFFSIGYVTKSLPFKIFHTWTFVVHLAGQVRRSFAVIFSILPVSFFLVIISCMGICSCWTKELPLYFIIYLTISLGFTVFLAFRFLVLHQFLLFPFSYRRLCLKFPVVPDHFLLLTSLSDKESRFPLLCCLRKRHMFFLCPLKSISSNLWIFSRNLLLSSILWIHIFGTPTCLFLTFFFTFCGSFQRIPERHL